MDSNIGKREKPLDDEPAFTDEKPVPLEGGRIADAAIGATAASLASVTRRIMCSIPALSPEP